MTIKEGKELVLHYLLPNFRSFDTKAKTSRHNFCQGQTPIISISLILFRVYANDRCYDSCYFNESLFRTFALYFEENPLSV